MDVRGSSARGVHCGDNTLPTSPWRLNEAYARIMYLFGYSAIFTLRSY